ncbi:membrane-spanning 4-domains subfamily A member 8-like isoform X1 [Phyllostomus hastatus]|uniref:membrane-spanning 4-domains subfamily A member 8-like isoform X1 n=1 Tax=Phyllostomus hastatus TaxID=9423 RepID=UPI001E685269|nr:membrane-spanning 4-domains subfamily A member 8-like isoform X1 [Phyllostomus hastatus]
MNSETSAGPMAYIVMEAAPQHTHSVNLRSTSQVLQYAFNQAQVLTSGNQCGRVNVQPAQRTFKEGKTLGALQILIGLIYIGLGIIMGTMLPGYYICVSFYGGVPFWGGISFIISGSLSVASEQQPKSPCLLKGSLGMNILSVIFSVVGICLFVTDICINPHSFYYNLEVFSFQIAGSATSGVQVIFSLLELCIASTCVHFGCQLVSNGTVVYQTVYVANPATNPEPVNLPPAYSHVVQDSQLS